MNRQRFNFEFCVDRPWIEELFECIDFAPYDEHSDKVLLMFYESELVGLVRIIAHPELIYEISDSYIFEEFTGNGLYRDLISKALSLLPSSALVVCMAKSHHHHLYNDLGMQYVEDEETLFEKLPEIWPKLKFQRSNYPHTIVMACQL